jgi:hypothetical protein
MWNFLFSGSVCPGNGTEETREESKVVGECQFVDSSESECDDDFEGESGGSWESEFNANDSLYIPTPIRRIICPINYWVLLPCLNWGNFWK